MRGDVFFVSLLSIIAAASSASASEPSVPADSEWHRHRLALGLEGGFASSGLEAFRYHSAGNFNEYFLGLDGGYCFAPTRWFEADVRMRVDKVPSDPGWVILPGIGARFAVPFGRSDVGVRIGLGAGAMFFPKDADVYFGPPARWYTGYAASIGVDYRTWLEPRLGLSIGPELTGSGMGHSEDERVFWETAYHLTAGLRAALVWGL